MEHWHSLTLERFLKPLYEHSRLLGGLEAPSIEANSSVTEMMELFLKSKSEALFIKNENLILIESEVFKQLYDFYQLGHEFQELKVRDFAKPAPQSLSDEATILEGLRFFYQFSYQFFIQQREQQTTLFSAKDLLQFFIIEFNQELENYQLSAGKMRTQLAVQSEDFFLNTTKLEGEIGGDIFLLPLTRLLMGKFIRVNETKNISQVIASMTEKSLSCSLVMEYETMLKGIITNRDLFRSYTQSKHQTWNDFEQWSEIKVSEIMTHNPDTLGLKHTVAHGLCLIHSGGYRQFIIVDEERVPLGVITLSDLLRFIARYLPDAPMPNPV